MGELTETGVETMTGCTADTVRCSNATNYREVTNPCCVEHITRMLGDISRVFDEAGITYWADYGTLMGAALHEGLIPIDKDGDYSALMTDWDKAQPAFRKLRDRYHVSVNHSRHSAKIRVSQKNHTNVDVFFWWHDKEWYPEHGGMLYRRRYARVDRNKGRAFPKEWLLPIERLPFNDVEVPVPREWETLIEHRYGDDWREPVYANNDGRIRGDWEPPGGSSRRRRRPATLSGNR